MTNIRSVFEILSTVAATAAIGTMYQVKAETRMKGFGYRVVIMKKRPGESANVPESLRVVDGLPYIFSSEWDGYHLIFDEETGYMRKEEGDFIETVQKYWLKHKSNDSTS